MNIARPTALMGVLAAMIVSTQAPAFSQTYYHGYVHRPTPTQKVRGYMYRHPKVKAATLGAGVGTAAGAVTGLISGRGVMRGALIGAGTGAGVGLIRSSQTLAYHPYLRATATGATAGLGLGLAGGHGHHSGIKGAAVGSAVGLGLGALGQVLR